jgi:hypothetical protein
MLRDIDGNSCELVERQLDIGIAEELRLFGWRDWKRYSGHWGEFQSGMLGEVAIFLFFGFFFWKAMEKTRKGGGECGRFNRYATGLNRILIEVLGKRWRDHSL